MAIPAECMSPPIMAIGDSLYQGVRSMTIRAGMLENSAPALVAEGLGVRDRFVAPKPPVPLIMDMEKWVRMVPDLGGIKRDLAANTRFWLADPAPSGPVPCHDNVAVASTLVADLYTDTWRTANDYIRALPADAADRIAELDVDGLDLGMIVQMLNTRFTLNPRADPDLADMTQLDLVAARRPRRLLINIGGNNGLWEIAFDANPAARLELLDDMRELAGRLAALPDAVERIYLNDLPLPSTIPNLMPVPDHAEWETKPGPDAYFDLYENRFGIAYGRITGDQMRALDAHVAETNAAVRDVFTQAFAGSERIRFVDVAGLVKIHNAKHERTSDRNVAVLANGYRISNVMIEAHPWGSFARGGFAGFDGIHTTVVGNGMLAGRVLETLLAAEPGTPVTMPDLSLCYERDRLLTDMPGEWSWGMWLWRDIRRARARGRAAISDVEADAAPDSARNAAVDAAFGTPAMGLKPRSPR